MCDMQRDQGAVCVCWFDERDSRSSEKKGDVKRLPRMKKKSTHRLFLF